MAAPDFPSLLPCLPAPGAWPRGAWCSQPGCALLTQPRLCLLINTALLGTLSDQTPPVTLLGFQLLFTAKQVLIFLRALIA